MASHLSYPLALCWFQSTQKEYEAPYRYDSGGQAARFPPDVPFHGVGEVEFYSAATARYRQSGE